MCKYFGGFRFRGPVSRKVRIAVVGKDKPQKGWAKVRQAWSAEEGRFGYRAAIMRARTSGSVWWEGPFRRTEAEAWADIEERIVPQERESGNA